MQMFYVETKNATEVAKEEECVSSDQENKHFKFVVPMPKKKNKKTKKQRRPKCLCIVERRVAKSGSVVKLARRGNFNPKCVGFIERTWI